MKLATITIIFLSCLLGCTTGDAKHPLSVLSEELAFYAAFSVSGVPCEARVKMAPSDGTEPRDGCLTFTAPPSLAGIRFERENGICRATLAKHETAIPFGDAFAFFSLFDLRLPLISSEHKGNLRVLTFGDQATELTVHFAGSQTIPVQIERRDPSGLLSVRISAEGNTP